MVPWFVLHEHESAHLCFKIHKIIGIVRRPGPVNHPVARALAVFNRIRDDPYAQTKPDPWFKGPGDVTQVIGAHQFDRRGAQDAHVIQLAMVPQHLHKPPPVAHGRHGTGITVAPAAPAGQGLCPF